MVKPPKAATKGAVKAVGKVAKEAKVVRVADKLPPSAVKARPRPKTEAQKLAPHAKYPSRRADGVWRKVDGPAPRPGWNPQKRALDLEEQVQGKPILRKEYEATVDGVKHKRKYDGLMQLEGNKYRAYEVKSGDARRTPNQRAFDALVSPTNPARAKIDGKPIEIIEVLDLHMPTDYV